MKVCPDCLENPAAEQRDGIKRDARCRACVRALERARRWRERYNEPPMA